MSNAKQKQTLLPEERHAILSALFDDAGLPKVEGNRMKGVTSNTRLMAERAGMLRAVPSEVHNLMICAELKNRFGGKLGDVGCFKLTAAGEFRLDLRKGLSKTGMLAPVFDGEHLAAIRVYRSAQDAKPFVIGNIPEDPDPGQANKESQKQTKVILDLIGDMEFFHTETDDCYAIVPVGDHLEIQQITTKKFRALLSRMFYNSQKHMPSRNAVKDAVENLCGKALFESPCHEVHVRVAEHEGSIYVDLANDDWEAVRISASGWEVVPSRQVPVKFRRPKGMLPLPRPIRGGDLYELKRFVNIEEKYFVLYVAWILSCFRPGRAFAILIIIGEHGSAKSTMAEFTRKLIDPNHALLRSRPRDERDLLIAATNSWVMAFDNLSGLTAEFSDAFARLSTGSGLATRELYTDSEEKLFRAERPLLLNGIDEFVTRPDLLDRSLILKSLRISERRRMSKDELERQFDAAQPGIFGALLDKLSEALRNLPSVKPKTLPRMADFALLGEAAFGNRFSRAYKILTLRTNETAIEASIVGVLIVRFMEGRAEWEGAASDLLDELRERASWDESRLKFFPKQANALSREINRIAPNLLAKKIVVSHVERGRRRRYIILTNTGKISAQPTPSSRRRRQIEFGTTPPPPASGDFDEFGPLLTRNTEGDSDQGDDSDDGDDGIANSE